MAKRRTVKSEDDVLEAAVSVDSQAPLSVSIADESYGESVTTDECLHVLRAVPFFDTLSDDDIAQLCSRLHARNYLPGATLFYEDDDPDAVYFLAEGAIEIFKSDQTGKKLPLIILRERGLLGEIGLLNNAPRTATARALCSARVLFLSYSDFHEGLEQGNIPMYRLVLAFSRILAQRLADMNTKIFDLFENETDSASFREANEFKQRLMATWTGLSLDTGRL